MMTPNPECAGLDTTLVDALHTMHDGKFLHLPVTDRGEYDAFSFCILRCKCGRLKRDNMPSSFIS